MKERITNLLARMASTRTPGGAIFAATAVITTVLAASSLGSYVDEHLFLTPLLNATAQFHLQPKLDPRLRVVMTDDSSLKALGRPPTLSEWVRIARLLEAEGFDRSLLQEPLDIASTLGDVPDGPAPRLFVGIVNVPPSKSTRLTSTADLPERLSFAGRGARPPHFTASVFALAPAATFLPFLAGLGSNDVLPDASLRTTLGLVDAKDRVYPSIGLLANSALRFADGRLFLGSDPVPLSADGGTYVDFVTMASVLALSVPVKAFFDVELGHARVVDRLSPALRTKLAGGKIAALVPGAFTGSRFLKSPVEGLVPAYLSMLSIASSALTGRFIHKPVSHSVVLMLVAPFFFFALARIRNTWLAFASTLGACIVLLTTGILGFILFGWYLPATSAALIAAFPFAVRLTQFVRGILNDRGKLRHELDLGHTVQSLLLPQEMRYAIGSWEIELTFKPYGAMAGDWYQIWTDGNGTAVVGIGDVVGKGASAALVTAAIAAVWHGQSLFWAKGAIDGGKLIEAIDTAVRQSFRGQQNSSLSLAILTPTSARLLCIAGPRWIHSPRGGKIGNVSAKPSNPLGMDAAECIPHFVDLIPSDGDSLLAFSDGVLDDAKSRRAFLDQMQKLEAGTEPPTLAVITALALEQSANPSIPDDQTILAIRFKKADAKDVAA